MRSLCNKHYNHNSLLPCCDWISWVLVGDSVTSNYFIICLIYVWITCISDYFVCDIVVNSQTIINYSTVVKGHIIHCCSRLLTIWRIFSFCELWEYYDILLLIRVSYQYVIISRFQVFHFIGLLKLHLLWKMSPICNLSYEFQVSFLKTAVKFIRSIAWASQWADLLTLTSFVSNNKVCLKVYFVQY